MTISELSTPLETRVAALEQSVAHLAGLVEALVRVSPLPTPVGSSRPQEAHDSLIDAKPSSSTPSLIAWPDKRKLEQFEKAVAPVIVGKGGPREVEPGEEERYAALGRLFMGIAHDVNNLLTVICGYAELLAEGLPDGDSRHETATTVAQLGHQAADLIRYLNDLGHGTGTTTPARINELLRRIGRLLTRFVGNDIRFSLQLGSEAGSVCLAPAELLQLVLNLIGNARDATPPNGTVCVRTAAHTFTSERQGWPDTVPPGDYAVLTVTDTGCGMDDAVRLRMFDPGFTTRREGGGQGIGLNTVRTLVKRVHGFIQVQSVIDWGTTVRLFFPTM